MVNNNGIPKTETVYEIKNEIPSYEEFLENYEKENSINYNDLTHEDINSNKGYGPCSWNNPNCECYLSESLIPLYLVCPVPKHQSPCYCNDTTPTSWFHVSGYLATTSRNAICGNLMISSEGRIKCVSCQVENDWSEWQFACDTHPRSYEYASKSEFAGALGYLNNLWKNKSFFGKMLVERMINRVISSGGFRYS